jgi:transcriptional regulator with XRE-family HTH domain
VTPTASDDERPELATNQAWREEMRRVRLEKGLSQDALSKATGARDQGQISRVETGEVGSSKLVLPICKALGIPPPEHFADEGSRRSIRALLTVQASDSPLARSMLDALEALADQIEAAKTSETQPEPPPKKTGKLT